MAPPSRHFRFGAELDFLVTIYSLIAYKAIEFSTNKKNQQLHSGYQYWNDNEAATDHGGVMADSCIRRMRLISHKFSTRNITQMIMH